MVVKAKFELPDENFVPTPINSILDDIAVEIENDRKLPKIINVSYQVQPPFTLHEYKRQRTQDGYLLIAPDVIESGYLALVRSCERATELAYSDGYTIIKDEYITGIVNNAVNTVHHIIAKRLTSGEEAD